MILILILIFIFCILFFLFILSVLCRQNPYEKYLSDIQQENFIKEHQHKKKSSL